MARPCKPGPKEFVLGAGDGDDQRIVAADPQEAFSAFFRTRNGGTCTIDDEPAGQQLVLMPDRGIIVRSTGAGPRRTEYLEVDRPNRYTPRAMLFFENGVRRARSFRPVGPRPRGPRRVTGGARCRPRSDDHDRHRGDRGGRPDLGGLGHRRPERPVVRLLRLARSRRRPGRTGRTAGPERVLGLGLVDAPAGAADGEVRVRRDPRLDAELERWS